MDVTAVMAHPNAAPDNVLIATLHWLTNTCVCVCVCEHNHANKPFCPFSSSVTVSKPKCVVRSVVGFGWSDKLHALKLKHLV